jgi:sugar phosphate isomerase/epimerase
MEPIGGFMVYTTDTFLRLRDACGDNLRAIVDPSAFWWMGVDPLLAIRQLQGAIGYAHAKDVTFDHHRVAARGVVPACRYEDWDARTWVPRTVGAGHSEAFWKDFFTTLRRCGYDGVVSVENEEPFLTPDEALASSLAMLNRVLPHEPMPTGNWFDHYQAPSTAAH